LLNPEDLRKDFCLEYWVNGLIRSPSGRVNGLGTKKIIDLPNLLSPFSPFDFSPVMKGKQSKKKTKK